MIYVDTSVLVTALTAEPDTEVVRTWLGRQAPGTLCVSGWVSTELSSALRMKQRRGELAAEIRLEVLIAWGEMQEDVVTCVPVAEKAFTVATEFVDDPRSTLRPGDALHLAVASLGGHRLATLDTRLAEVATRAGVPVEVIG